MRMIYAAILVCATSSLASADWPQFMRNSAHTGDAADETLRLPLKLVAQVKLEDAVVSSPGNMRTSSVATASDGITFTR